MFYWKWRSTSKSQTDVCSAMCWNMNDNLVGQQTAGNVQLQLWHRWQQGLQLESDFFLRKMQNIWNYKNANIILKSDNQIDNQKGNSSGKSAPLPTQSSNFKVTFLFLPELQAFETSWLYSSHKKFLCMVTGCLPQLLLISIEQMCLFSSVTTKGCAGSKI